MDSSQSQSGFRSRRSYPTLHHVSLSPLNPRFPIDDDTDAPDYFSPSHEITGTPSTTRTSYLSSFSVPGTPGVLSHSHSRSGSRVRRHSRSKSSTRIHSSDTNLQSRSVASPLHHQQNEEPRRSRTRSSRRHPDAVHHHHNPDTEWMLRAGIALASSTREEKGQSWLVKRQSSTSLVSDSHQIDLDSQQHQQPWTSRSSTRRSQSGISTPAAYSRRASRSRPTSRRSSRPDLAMTSLDITRFSGRREIPTTTSSSGIHTPLEAEQSRHMLPDFVDERIRAEMANIASEEDEGEEEDNLSFTSTSDSLHASEDELDEQEFQRLTRERGFGLGSWIDRMVEWTLFGVDDWPLSTTTTTAPPAVTSVETTDHDPQSLMHENIRSQETDTISIATESDIASISEEKPGTRGGWEDAGWLFRVVKRALS
ncbi:hypothetical protein CBS63078_3906 [Aspergillus niger]|uniref:Uncharacterized protein n=1 Tax=Aspergillus niger TaxID=5061 RepID=A0A3F3RPQ7_ASPNG|nr:uncharacterized protein BO96DRAFT_498368 [Aspergillus niger CBS 101883]KAI2912091.1 hypothetical protein CBS63078_3906 [Aspergillus niger]KAI2957517.1 hypothetical protein CBS147322_2125 [Aspergillus niger]KAI3033396.1 hypothetical protein CBS147345_960 [Aspergillus niger]PYH59710.1 hypothetical protein BO96DRAFT_498368 [Aspergillus niger CBS 101883]SPB50148.1 unnamed protein product [Aspergillus niger]